MPATIVGALDNTGKANFLLVAHLGIVSHSKLLLSMYGKHYTNSLVKATKKVSVALIDESFLAKADYTGTVSGANKDKSHIFEYQLGELGTPVITQSPLVMECEVIDQYDIDGFENFICDVKNTYVDDTLFDSQGKIDYNKLKPVLFEMPTYKYLQTGPILGDCVKLGKTYAADNKL